MTEEIEKKRAIEDFAVYVDGLLKEFLEKNPSIAGPQMDLTKLPMGKGSKLLMKGVFKTLGVDPKELSSVNFQQASKAIRHLVYNWIVKNPDQIKELLSKSLVKLTELKNRLGEGE